jgi:hypothetical protein
MYRFLLVAHVAQRFSMAQRRFELPSVYGRVQLTMREEPQLCWIKLRQPRDS